MFRKQGDNDSRGLDRSAQPLDRRRIRPLPPRSLIALDPAQHAAVNQGRAGQGVFDLETGSCQPVAVLRSAVSSPFGEREQSRRIERDRQRAIEVIVQEYIMNQQLAPGLKGSVTPVDELLALGDVPVVQDIGEQDHIRTSRQGIMEHIPLAQFETVYPGWYQGRTVHIHFKLRLFAGSTKTYEFTSQLFMDEALTNSVYTQSPYKTRGARTTRNAQDGIYNSLSASEKTGLTLQTSKTADGYAGVINLGVSVG